MPGINRVAELAGVSHGHGLPRPQRQRARLRRHHASACSRPPNNSATWSAPTRPASPPGAPRTSASSSRSSTAGSTARCSRVPRARCSGTATTSRCTTWPAAATSAAACSSTSCCANEWMPSSPSRWSSPHPRGQPGCSTCDKPIVGVGGPLRGVRTLSIDDVEVARLATEHLLSLGHRKIAHIGGTKTTNWTSTCPPTDASATRAPSRRSASPPTRACSRRPTSPSKAVTRQQSNCSATPALRPTAVFAASDEMAIGDHPRRPRHGAQRSGGRLGDRRRRPRAQRVLRADHGRAVPRPPGDAGGGDPDGPAAPGQAANAVAQHPLPFELIVRSSTARPRSHLRELDWVALTPMARLAAWQIPHSTSSARSTRWRRTTPSTRRRRRSRSATTSRTSAHPSSGAARSCCSRPAPRSA